MPMLCMKTTAIVIKHSTCLATDSGYFKTKKNLHMNVDTSGIDLFSTKHLKKIYHQFLRYK